MNDFFQPEIQVINFAANDPIGSSTVGGVNTITFRYTGLDKTANCVPNDFGHNANITPEMLSEFKTQVPIANYRGFYLYDYDTHKWSYVGQTKP